MFLKKINRKSVFYNLSAIAVSNTILQLMGFAYRIFLSRVAGAEGLGVHQLVMPFYSVISSLTLTGLTVAVARLSAEHAASANFRGATSTVSRARRAFTLVLLCLTVICLLNRDFISKKILGDERTSLSIPFVFLCLLLTGYENIYKNYFYGVGKVVPQIVSELSEQLVRALAVAALLFTLKPRDAGVCAMLIIAGMVISELFSSNLLSLFYRPEKRRGRARKGKVSTYAELSKIAIPVSFAATANNVLSSLNSILIPRRLIASGATLRSATEAFGVMFGMTMPLLTFPIAFMASLTSVMVPRISEHKASDNMPEMRRKAGKTIHATSLLAMPCMAILIPLGAPLCQILFSNPDAGSYILPLSLATLFSYYEMTTGALLNGIGKEKSAALFIIIGRIIQLFFTWSVGLPHIGLLGFAIGYLVSSALIALLNFLCLKRTLKLKPRFSNWFLTPLLASLLSALIAKILYDLFLSYAVAPLMAILLALCLGICVYALSLYALGTDIVKYIKNLSRDS